MGMVGSWAPPIFANQPDDAPPNFTTQTPIFAQEPPNLLQQAQEQYPVLKPGGGYLEHWGAGEQGVEPTPSTPMDGLRPQALPLDKPGLEIRDPNTRPIDILGDIVSHHLVNVDPVVKGAYQNLQDSMTPQQHAILQDQYQYAQKNEGENRSYEDWKSASGMPGFLRGYTFQQWPKEFNDKAYTPQQRQRLDALMNYLKGGR